jgi:predicted PurR-regulated permease PerM
MDRDGQGWEGRLVWRALAGVAGLYLAWLVRDVLVLVFAAVVGAVVLDGVVRLVRRVGRVPRAAALGLAGVVMVAAIGGPGVLIGAEIGSQVDSAIAALPGAVRALEEMLGVEIVPAADGEGGGRLEWLTEAVRDVSGSVASVGRAMVGGVSAAVLVVVGAFFLAADPGLYVQGVVKMFPRQRHGQVEDALAAAGAALRLWLGAQLVAMAIVGVVVGLGAWWIGLPAPLALGLFAALAEFVPTVGAFVGAVPALLLAVPLGWEAVAWTGGLVLVVQQVESNVVTPIVQRRMARIPPALLLFTVVAAGVVFGLGGVVVAAPLTVVGLVLVKKLYVRQVLGQETEVPGEQ